MSGICGIFHLDGAPVERTQLEAMAEASAYRGPHGRGFWVDGAIGLGHLALHTTPEAVRESQPLVDGNVVVVADARVDDREHLMRHLRVTGHLHIDAPTDVDLILAAYRRWGKDWPEHVRGDYAVAVWDRQEHTLLLVRDATGIRPLHYHYDGHRLLFGSDTRQVLTDLSVPRDLDGYYILHWLTANFAEETRTPFAGVRSLLAGHCFLVDTESIQGWRWWTPENVGALNYRDDLEYVAGFRELFFRCVSDRLRSAGSPGKHAGIYLSGGLDSSSIAATAAHIYESIGPAAHLFGYHVFSTTHGELDESRYVHDLHKNTTIDIYEARLEDFVLHDSLDMFPTEPDAPVPSNHLLSHHLLSLACENGCRVWLTGHGGDDLFLAGRWRYYDIMQNFQWAELLTWIKNLRADGYPLHVCLSNLVAYPLMPRTIRAYLEHRGNGWRFAHRPPWVRVEALRREYGYWRSYGHVWPRRFQNDVRQKQYELLAGACQERLRISWWNRSTAKHQMDAAFPFMDARLAEFLIASPLRFSAMPGDAGTKWILRQAMQSILPESIRQRATKARGIHWIADTLSDECNAIIRGLLYNMCLENMNFVDAPLLRLHRARLSKGHATEGVMPLWYLLYLESWLRTWTPSSSNISYSLVEPWEKEI